MGIRSRSHQTHTRFRLSLTTAKVSRCRFSRRAQHHSHLFQFPQPDPFFWPFPYAGLSYRFRGRLRRFRWCGPSRLRFTELLELRIQSLDLNRHRVLPPSAQWYLHDRQRSSSRGIFVARLSRSFVYLPWPPRRRVRLLGQDRWIIGGFSGGVAHDT